MPPGAASADAIRNNHHKNPSAIKASTPRILTPSTQQLTLLTTSITDYGGMRCVEEARCRADQPLGSAPTSQTALSHKPNTTST